MELRPIKSEADYQTALERLEQIFDAPIGTPESDEADIVGLMVDDYEGNIIRLMPPTPSKPLR